MSGVDASVLRVAIVLEYAFLMWSGFRQATCAKGGVARGAWFACKCIDDDAAAEQPLFTVSKRGRTYVVVKLTEVCWT